LRTSTQTRRTNTPTPKRRSPHAQVRRAKNLVRTFHEIRERAGLPRITVHHTRHTAATSLKNLGVPARDAQLILGHAHITTTQQLYQHGDIKAQTDALARVGEMLTATVAVTTAVKTELSTGESANIPAFTPGGPGGARTLDTLLKRLLWIVSTDATTPVVRNLRTRTYAHIFGWVAVKYCCNFELSTGPDERQGIIDDIAILHSLRTLDVDLLRRRCFSHCLIPTSTASGFTTPTQEGERR